MSSSAVTRDDWRNWIDQRANNRRLCITTERDLPPGVFEAYKVDGADFNVDPISSIEYDEDGVYLHIKSSLKFDYFPSELGVIERRIDTSESAVQHTNFYVPTVVQGSGHAKRMMKRAVHLYDMLEIDEVRVQAAATGRYIWAHCGFEFASVSDKKKVNSAAKQVAVDLGLTDDESWVDVEYPWKFRALDASRDDGAQLLVPHQSMWKILSGRRNLPALPSVDMAPSKVLLLYGDCHSWNGVLKLNAKSVGRAQLMEYTKGYS